MEKTAQCRKSDEGVRVAKRARPDDEVAPSVAPIASGIHFVIQELKGPREALLDVFPGLPEFKNGYVYANDNPGLGVEINKVEAAKYPCENTVTTWTQTRLADGTLQTP
jgi:hypothetical protein